MDFDPLYDDLPFTMIWFRSKYKKQIDDYGYLIVDVAFDVKEELDPERKHARMSFFCVLARRTFPKLSFENAWAVFTSLRVCQTRDDAIDKLVHGREPPAV